MLSHTNPHTDQVGAIGATDATAAMGTVGALGTLDTLGAFGGLRSLGRAGHLAGFWRLAAASPRSLMSLRSAVRQLETAAALTLLTFSLVSPAPALAGIGPSVRDVVEFTRIIQPAELDAPTLQTQRSPDGERLFVVTRKADVTTDTNQYDVLLLDVSSRQLDSGKVAAPTAVLSVRARRDNNDAFPSLADVRWVDDRTLVLRARMNDEPFQAYKLDVQTRQLTQLTHAPYGVLSFDASRDLQRLVYLSPVPNPPMPNGARSVVAGTHSFWSLHFGQQDMSNQLRRYQFFTVQAGSRGQERPLGAPFDEGNMSHPIASISPDGRHAVLPRQEPERQQIWSQQYPYVAQTGATLGAAALMDPLRYFIRASSYVSRRVTLYRLEDQAPIPIVDAPDDATTETGTRAAGLWMNGGRSVIIAGTFLPRRAGAQEPDVASHVIEFWPDSGQWRDVATLRKNATWAVSEVGDGDRFVVLDGDQPRRFVRAKARDAWREEQISARESARVAGVDRSAEAMGVSARAAGAQPPRWQVQVRQALNVPPDIEARGPGGATLRLTELNPAYNRASWGTMREFEWRDASGRVWKGGLMVPSDFDAGRRHALVIQSYGFSPDRFYRDGSNIYDGFTSGFAGRAFLRDNLLVLALPNSPQGDSPKEPRAYRSTFVQGVRGAIDALVAQGIVDRERVGLMGWSRTGESVLNLVTFSDVPMRAASLLDGDSNTLFSLTITNAALDGMLIRKERMNQGGPYGATRLHWVRNDPSLHTECIRAALRIETYGAAVHNNWDIYALMRRQFKPAEMIKFPEGAHALGRPSDRMISLQGNVDWYRFWLNGEKRTEPSLPGETAESLTQQYQRWDQMRTLKDADDKTPVCDKDRLQ